MKLRTRLLVALCVVGLVLGSTTYVGFELLQDRSVAQSEAAVERTATMVADRVTGEIRERKSRVAYLAARPAARGDDVEPYLRTFVRNTRFVGASVVAPNGTVRAAYAEPGASAPAVGADHSDREYVSRALAGETSVSRLACSGGDCRVRISAPVFAAGDDGSSVAGALAATIPVGDGVFFASATDTGQTTTAYVVAPTRNGTVTFGGSRRAYRQNITATATVAPTDWEVTVSRDRARLNSRLRTALYAQFGVLGIVLASVAAFGVWEYRTNLRAVDRLLEGLSELSRGEYDHRLSLSAAEEWETIADRFDQLATTLADREAEIEEQRRRRSMLHRILRHNVRNDINVIMGRARLIPDHTDDERVTELAADIAAMSRKLTDQADKARRLEELVAGPTTVEPTELTSIVEEALSQFGDRYDASITTDMPEAVHVAASSLLPHAVAELCENAVEHNTDDPTVEVVVDAAEATDSVRLAVRDDGPGIPPQDRRVLTGAEETAVSHGSGIGIRFVYWTVQHVDGDVLVADNDLGGTTITLVLPRASSPPPDQNAGAGDDESADGADETE
ncbi:MAG: ATP-binding protein [Halolamina sp.]